MTLRNPSPTGVVIGPLRATRSRLIDFEDVLGERRPVLGHDAFAGVDDVPVEADPRRLEDHAGRRCDLWPDTVPGDERDRVGHG